MLKPLAGVTLLAAAISLSASNQTVAPAMPDALGWLAGCWSRAESDRQIEEHWMKPAGGTMLGMGRTVRGGKTTEFEFLQIREVNGKLAYVAKPSGQAESTFPVKSLTDAEVVFEDLAHDFPQRIIYRRTPGGAINARVEGTRNGQTRGIDYAYQRCQ
jgi:hypothetical protein